MSKIAIVTDSTADIPEVYVEQLDIKIVPLKVFFGEEEYKDWIELKPEDFYKMLEQNTELPRTSQPSPADFVEMYESLAPNYDTIISIHISSKLSGTYQSALVAKDMVKDVDIEVIDTEVTSMVLGLIVIEAARAVKKRLEQKGNIRHNKRY